MKKFVPILVALAAVSLSGCGGSGSSSSSSSSSSSDGSSDGSSKDSSDSGGETKCSDIWKVGKTLDITPYAGCQDDDTYIVGMTSGCYDADSNYIGQSANYKKQLWVVQKGTDPQLGKGGTPGKVTDVDPKC